jgi:DNA-binding Lrp family transcriptional regulator
MARSSRKQIYEDEIKIINQLKKNARESIDEIAKRCGFSRQKVWRIINRLEENKIIWGYSAITDNGKLEQNSYLMLIKKSNEPIEKLAERIISREIEEKISELGITLESSHYLNGQYDWLICFTAEDIIRAKKFGELVNKTFSKHISEIVLIEKIFSVKKCGIQNPSIHKLRDFV